MKDIDTILNIIDQVSDEDPFLVFGIRSQEANAQVGDILPNSYAWVDGEKTDEELDGACCMHIATISKDSIIKAINKLGNKAQKRFGLPVNGYNAGYNGDNFLLVCGEYGKGGEDIGEIVIRDAKVIAVF